MGETFPNERTAKEGLPNLKAQRKPETESNAHSPLLEVRGISYSYERSEELFHDVNFRLYPGDILTILGANGSGKSTMLNCLTGLFAPKTGLVKLDGEDIAHMGDRRIAQKLSMVQQVHAATYGFTVNEYLLMGRAPYIEFAQMPSEEDYAIVNEVMEELGISYLADKSYNEISGGERQQVQIGRALVQKPNLIVLDEPTNHLDFGNQLKVLQLLKRLSHDGYAIILTTHMPDHAILLNGIVGILSNDHRFIVGRSDRLITTEMMQDIYNIDLDVFYCEHLDRPLCAYGKLDKL